MTSSDEPRRPFTLDRRRFLEVAGASFSVAVGASRWQRAQVTEGQRDPAGSTGTPTFPPTLTPLQPKSPQDIQTLLDYDPVGDPNARYMRCHVPIASRVALPAVTQANPKLDGRPRISSLNGYYNQYIGGAPWIGDTRYGYDQRPYVTRFAQYQDYLGGWSGAQTIPNPAYVDVAHRNGTLSLGIIFQPYFSSTPGAEDTKNDFVARDAAGNFLVGNKLVDLAAYFGYDGYFLNIEELRVTQGQASELAQMFDAMHARARSTGMPAFYLQIYDAIWTTGDPDGRDEYEEKFDQHNAGWIEPGQRVDSIFIDYAWPQHFVEPKYAHASDNVASSLSTAHQLGLDPYQVLFFGLDVEEENDGVHANALDYYADQVIPVNGDGPALGSFALFAQSDRLFLRTRDQLGSKASDASAFQSAIYVGDRKFWSGKAENPASLPRPVHPTAGEVVSPKWLPQYGVANFIPERTVIGSLPFTTHFNTGQGERFFLAGGPAGQRLWYNMSAQDMLPTWQWWTRDVTGRTGATGLLAVDYDQTTAYDGGTSLRIFGYLSRPTGTEVRLYKTGIDASQSAVVSLVARDGIPGSIDDLRAGVSYSDEPTETQWLTPNAGPTDAGGGWKRVGFELQPHPGTLITALSVGAFAAPSEPGRRYDVYVGELGIAPSTPAAAPGTPIGFTVDSATNSRTHRGLTVGLSWQLATSGVWYYDLRTAGPKPQWLGRIFGDAYVLDQIGSETAVALVAVGYDGTESKPALVMIR
jgi:endo-beta-N-acetylglucosaminidase D